jgi:sensor c-di-GMP phosphodiesterase-like protein
LPLEECPIRRAYEGGAVVRVENDVFIRRDGSELPVAYTAAPISTDNGVEGCVVLYQDITERKAETLRMERDLEKLTWLKRIQEALAEKRFVLYAQPIIDLKTGQVVQREMLLRMRDGDEPDTNPGVIAPGLFLPVAEEYGLITEIDFLKIDIEFVRDLRSNIASRHVVETIVNLATRFSLKTVGEGAEDQETVDLLRELGVDYAQGFHIGRPAPQETPIRHDNSGADRL